MDDTKKKILNAVAWTGHAGFHVRHNSLNLYIDPVDLPQRPLPKADIVLLTHAHPRHYSPADINAISRVSTVVAGPADCVAGFKLNQLHLAPGDEKTVLGIRIKATPAQGAHTERKNWLGFLLRLGGFELYHEGDADPLAVQEIRADAAIVSAAGGAEAAAARAERTGAKLAIGMLFDGPQARAWLGAGTLRYIDLRP